MARPVLANASERVAPPAITAEDRLESGIQAHFEKSATETIPYRHEAGHQQCGLNLQASTALGML
jgi:hypothetical protein